MTSIAMLSKPPINTSPRVLVVDDEPALHELIGDVCEHNLGCKLLAAASLGQAKAILAQQPVELVIIDVHLPDGDGLSLLPLLSCIQPQACSIVITGEPTLDGAVHALRRGAVDFLPKPFNAEQLLQQVRQALHRQAAQTRDRRRMLRLRDAVRRLNDARKVVSKKVDLLCNDLISAYGDLSRELDLVRNQENFRTALAQAQDLEQMLCHAMDWLLKHLGHANIAIWLATQQQDFQLGAYMKYTLPGEPELTDAMKLGLVPMTVRQELVHLSPQDAEKCLTPAELGYLKGHTVLASHCVYLGESLATLVLFRNGEAPFTPEHAALLKAVSPIFAIALASAVHTAQPGEKTDEFGNTESDESPDKNDGDWWKRGEAPPF